MQEFRKKIGIDSFLRALINEKQQYLILLAVKGDSGKCMRAQTIELLKEIGFNGFSNQLWKMYIGVIDCGDTIIDMSAQLPEQSLQTDLYLGSDTHIYLESRSLYKGNVAKIKIDGMDCSENVRGINIVVYDLENKELVDSIGFDSQVECGERFKRNYLNIFKDEYAKRCSVDSILSIDNNTFMEPYESMKIIKQPADCSAKVGEEFCYTIDAIGDGLEYDWQYQWPNQTKWTRWKNGNTISLCRTMRTNWDNLKVRCVINDSRNNRIESKEVSLRLKTDTFKKHTNQINSMNTKIVEKSYFTDGPIKVRILYWGGPGGYFWNVIHSVVDEYKMRINVDLKVITFFDFDKKIEKILKDEHVNFCHLNEWDIENDMSDILFFIATNVIWGYKEELLKNLRLNSKCLVFLPICVILNEYDSKDRLVSKVRWLDEIGVDYIFVDRILAEVYSELKKDVLCKIVETGNPKYDQIFHKLQTKREIPVEWKKIKGKKIFLWLVDHDWNMGFNVSFDIYAKTIFQYFEKRDDVALIFRPHPVFVSDIVKFGIWNKDDANKLRGYIDKSDSIIWDDLPDYSLSYNISDAMMMEVGSGVTISALCTRKPIAILFKEDYEVNIHHPEIIDCYYKCYNPGDVIEYIERMIKGEDSQKEARDKVAENYIAHFDGQNGKRIVDFLDKELGIKTNTDTHMMIES